MKHPLNNEQLRRIVKAMRAKGASLRQVARNLGLHRKTIKKLLDEPTTPGSSTDAPPKQPSKLDPFARRIEELSRNEKLTHRKIFQILRQEGYAGGKTILSDRIRSLRGSRKTRKAFARYEPAPGIEAQCDWSPYRVKIDGRDTRIHLFSMILSYTPAKWDCGRSTPTPKNQRSTLR